MYPLRETPSRDYVSSASSSYAASQASSSFTLSSATDSSVSSGLFDNQRQPSSSSSASNAFATQLKKIYHQISRLEEEIKQYDSDNHDHWDTRVQTHKKFIANVHHLLEITLAPSRPASLRNVPTRYNLVNRLWTHGFSLLLETLRRAAFLATTGPPEASQIALEHLNDFIFYAYAFYAALLEEPYMATFRPGWLEALGDLARYKSMVESFLERSGKLETSSSSQPHTQLSAENLYPKRDAISRSDASIQPMRVSENQSDHRASLKTRTLSIGTTCSVSLGARAGFGALAGMWRENGMASVWVNNQEQANSIITLVYCAGMLLAMLQTQEGSLVALHPYYLSRESLPLLFAPLSEHPTTTVSTLFMTLHRMLFTESELNYFTETLTRLTTAISDDSVSEPEWAAMAVINIAAALEPGRPTAALRLVMGTVSTGHEDPASKMQVEQSQSTLTPAPIHALELAFDLLSYTLQYPYRNHTHLLNPYIPVLLTFLTTLLKRLKRSPDYSSLSETVERLVPWQQLADFLQNFTPQAVWESERLLSEPFVIEERWPMLTTATTPLPEDWCLRGMEWVGRQVYERGFWKDRSGDDEKLARTEIKYLYVSDEEEKSNGQSGHHYQGIISTDPRFMPPASTRRNATLVDTNHNRHVRILRCGIILSTLVRGFSWSQGTRSFAIDPSLTDSHAMQVDG